MSYSVVVLFKMKMNSFTKMRFNMFNMSDFIKDYNINSLGETCSS